jgi:hypothetical protein
MSQHQSALARVPGKLGLVTALGLTFLFLSECRHHASQ